MSDLSRKALEFVHRQAPMYECDEIGDLIFYAYMEGAEYTQKVASDKAKVTRGAMILDGYDEYDSCIKYMGEYINDIINITK